MLQNRNTIYQTNRSCNFKSKHVVDNAEYGELPHTLGDDSNPPSPQTSHKRSIQSIFQEVPHWYQEGIWAISGRVSHEYHVDNNRNVNSPRLVALCFPLRCTPPSLLCTVPMRSDPSLSLRVHIIVADSRFLHPPYTQVTCYNFFLLVSFLHTFQLRVSCCSLCGAFLDEQVTQLQIAIFQYYFVSVLVIKNKSQ